jgi:hypothetical protein
MDEITFSTVLLQSFRVASQPFFILRGASRFLIFAAVFLYLQVP